MSERHIEIVELHQFFEGWLGGSISRSKGALARFADVLAPSFEHVSPRGTLLARGALIEGIDGAHGAHADNEPPFRIWIDNLEERRLGNGWHLVTYEEWQALPDGPRGRLSTAVLADEAGTPNGLVWHHVHETWLPG